MQSANIFTTPAVNLEASRLLAKTLGGLEVIENYLQTAKDLFESDPPEAQSYLEDALKKIEGLKREMAPEESKENIEPDLEKGICPACGSGRLFEELELRDGSYDYATVVCCRNCGATFAE